MADISTNVSNQTSNQADKQDRPAYYRELSPAEQLQLRTLGLNMLKKGMTNPDDGRMANIRTEMDKKIVLASNDALTDTDKAAAPLVPHKVATQVIKPTVANAHAEVSRPQVTVRKKAANVHRNHHTVTASLEKRQHTAKAHVMPVHVNYAFVQPKAPKAQEKNGLVERFFLACARASGQIA